MIKEVDLGTVCQFENGDRGKNYPSQSAFVDVGIPFINAGNLDNYIINRNDLNYITEDRYNLLGSGKLQPNDILFCLRGSLGKFAINSEAIQGAIASSLVLLRAKEELNIDYLKHYLKSDRVKRLIYKSDNGSSQPNLSASNVKKFPIPLPPLDQQEKIAAILDAADEYRQKTKALIAKYDELTQSLFLDMFGDPVTNPKVWEKEPLGSLSKRIVVGHVGPTSDGYTESGIPFLRTQNVRPNFINYNDLAQITPEFHNKLKKSQIFAKDVLISRVGVNRGMAAVVPDDLNEANCANVVIVGSSVLLNSYYLSFFLNKSYGTKPEYGYSVGSAQGVVNTSIVKKWPIFKVPLNFQNQFTERVQAIEAQKVQAQESLVKAEELFNSLLQRAFKGELK